MTFTVAILAVVLGYTWIVDPIAPNWGTPIAVVIVLALAIGHVFHAGSKADAQGRWRQWGLTPAALVPALWASVVLTTVGGIGIYLAGSRLGTWHPQRDPWMTLLVLIPWGFGQQFALHTVFLRDAQQTFGRWAGIVVAAACFAALHLPNPFLSAMTFAGALAWCWIYDRHPNLLPLALSHALLTLAILCAFDERLTGHLRVGAAYLSLR
jgi:membrane protease YdiL (CAAX protease family)